MDHQNALEFVQSFYEQTWNNLLWFCGIAIAIVGIFVPLIIQWISSKNHRKQMEELSESTKREFESQTTKLEEKYNAVKKELLFTQGCVYLTHANILMKSDMDEKGAHVLHTLLRAAYSFLRLENSDCLNVAINALINIITASDFPSVIPSNVDRINVREIYDMVLSLFEKNNTDGRYTTIMQMLRKKVRFEN